MTTTNNDYASRDCLAPPFVRWYTFFRWLVFGLLGALLLALVGRSLAYAAIAAPTLAGPTGTVEVDRYALSGKGTADSLVRVTLNDLQLGETVVDADGDWSIETDTLTAGDYEAIATAYDPENGERGSSSALLWTVATGTAVAEVVDELAEIEYQAPTIELTRGGVDSAEVTLSGAGSPGTTVEIFRNGESVGSAEVGADGIWAFATTADEVENEFEAHGSTAEGESIGMSNVVGLMATAAAAGLTFDGLTSVGEFSATSNNDPDSALAAINASGTGEPGAIVELFANGESVGTATVNPDGTWTFSDEGAVPVGDLELTARMTMSDGTSLDGQPTASFEVPSMVEETMPEASRAELMLDGIATSESGEVLIGGSAEPGATVEITVDGDVVATVTAGDDGMWSYSGTFEAGDHTVDVRDASGNGDSLASDAFVIAAVNGDGDESSNAGEDSADSADNSASEDATEGDSTDATDASVTDADLAIANVASVDDAPTIGTVDFGMSGTGRPGVQLAVLEDGVQVGGAVVQADGTWSCTCSLPPGEHLLVVQDANDPSYTSEPVSFIVENLTQLPPPPEKSNVVVSCSGTPPMGEIRGHLYVVAQCESFGLIAERLGTSVQDLLEFNPQITDARLIYPGQILNIPSDAGCFDDNG